MYVCQLCSRHLVPVLFHWAYAYSEAAPRHTIFACLPVATLGGCSREGYRTLQLAIMAETLPPIQQISHKCNGTVFFLVLQIRLFSVSLLLSSLGDTTSSTIVVHYVVSGYALHTIRRETFRCDIAERAGMNEGLRVTICRRDKYTRAMPLIIGQW